MRHLIDFGDMSRAEWESLYSQAVRRSEEHTSELQSHLT